MNIPLGSFEKLALPMREARHEFIEHVNKLDHEQFRRFKINYAKLEINLLLGIVIENKRRLV